THSQSKLPASVGSSSARCGMAKSTTPMPSSPASSSMRSRLPARSAAMSVQRWPRQPTYWRSSSQTGQRSGGRSPASNWVPQVSQMGWDIGCLLVVDSGCGRTTLCSLQSGPASKPVHGDDMEPVFPFDLDLPRRGAGTLAGALHRQLRAAILDGRLAAGTVLPSTRRAAGALGIARNTVVAAFDLLVAEGYVQPRTAARAVVADVAARRPPRPAHGAPPARIPRRWLEPGLAREQPRALPARSFRLGMPESRD